MYEVKDTSAGRCLICGCTVHPWEFYCRHCKNKTLAGIQYITPTIDNAKPQEEEEEK